MAVLAAAGFVVVHVLFAQAVPLVIDIDEFRHGDIGIAILDGLLHDLISRRFPIGPSSLPHDGFYVMFGPIIAPFFLLFGATLRTMQAAYVVLAGGWAAVWASTARLVAPRAPLWAVVGLFVLPAPFLSRYAVSPVAMPVHLGVSAAHGLTVLLLLLASRRSPRNRGILFGAGLAAG